MTRIREMLALQVGRIWKSATQRVISTTGLGMALALLADILVAARFGTSTTADALIVAISLPRLVETVARESTKFSLVPFFIEYQNHPDKTSYSDFAVRLLNLFLVIGVLIALVGWAIAPQLVSLTGPGLPPPARAESALLLRLSMPLVIFALGSTVLSVMLNSEGHFVVVSTRNMAMPSVVIVATIAAWSSSQLPIWIALAYSVGSLLFFVALLRYSQAHTSFRYRLTAMPTRGLVHQVSTAVTYPAIGFGVRQGSRVVERALASTVMPGGVAAYYFAFRLVSALQTIVGTSVATTSLPRMARHSLVGNREAFLSHMKSRVGKTILISAPLALVTAILARPIVGLFYGRGEFDAGSVELTSQILRIFAFGIVFSCLVPILNSGLYARRKYAWVLGNMLFVSGANVLATWGLSTIWGLAGIALATDLVSGLSVATLTSLNRLRWPQFYEQKSDQSPTLPLDA